MSRTPRPTKPEKFDERDRRILDELEVDAWLSYADLAARINLSASAVQRRVERLVANGMILGARARLAPEATRHPVRMFVLVSLVDEAATTLRAFTKSIEKAPGVVAASYVAGEPDIVLMMQSTTMEDYAAFAEKHLNGARTVKRYQTLTVLKTLI